MLTVDQLKYMSANDLAIFYRTHVLDKSRVLSEKGAILTELEGTWDLEFSKSVRDLGQALYKYFHPIFPRDHVANAFYLTLVGMNVYKYRVPGAVHYSWSTLVGEMTLRNDLLAELGM